MRAHKLGLDGLVFVTTCLWFIFYVKADPVSITVIPDGPLTLGVEYTVSWPTPGFEQVFVGGLFLLELFTGQAPSTLQTIIPIPSPTSCTNSGKECVGGIVLSPETSTKFIFTPNSTIHDGSSHSFELLWASTSTVKATKDLMQLMGPPVDVNTRSSASATSGVGTNPSSLSSTQKSQTTSQIPGAGPVKSTVTSDAAAGGATASQSQTGQATGLDFSQSTDGVISHVPSSDNGLSVGAKVGIAIGTVGFVLLALIAALLLWRRSRQRRLQTLPDSSLPYNHESDSTHRDLTAEKEMNVISHSPVNPYDSTETRHSGGYAPPETTQQVAAGQAVVAREQRGSWAGAGAGDDHRGSYGSAPENARAHSPVTASTSAAAPVVVSGPVVARKPVGTAGPTHHLREPGMSDEEVARLEEEERRLDEAIAEAERRRENSFGQGHG